MHAYTAGNREADRGGMVMTPGSVSPQQDASGQDSGRSSIGSGRQQADILSGATEEQVSSGSHHDDMTRGHESYG